MYLKWFIYAYMLLNKDEWLYALNMKYLRKYRQSYDVQKGPYEP
ncbi:A-kinase anchor SPHKAP [Gossypium arboreum]|uniref:A-kinase anchor SPHKAP n=1 Tax=Gossypium arboreum TaxID=29729 RepID=A0A0B0MZ72_GOSAR|nr:A-kinase anchor SPHKAP [Gossypium arboreum]